MKRILKRIIRFLPNYLRLFVLRRCGYIIADKAYISPDIKISDLNKRKGNIIIGNRVSIGPGVILITDSSSNNSILTIKYPIVSGKIILEDDCWLSAGAIILPNVRIGKCSIVAAGAVVTTDVPPFTVYGGIPAKKIKSLNPQDFNT